MYCKRCGRKLDDDSVFCVECGQKVNAVRCDDGREGIEPALIAENSVPSNGINEKAATGKKNAKRIIALVLAAILIISLFVFYRKQKTEHLEAFETQVTRDDIVMTYDIGKEFVTVTLVPRYDIEELTFELLYSGPGLLLRTDRDSYTVEYAKAGTTLIYAKALSDLDQRVAEQGYVSLGAVGGMKQNKFAEKIEVACNTECDFKFSVEHYDRGSSVVNCQLTNKTDTPILELREFRISAELKNQGGRKAKLEFYTPRLVLDRPLMPKETMRIEGLDGNVSFSSNSELVGASTYASVSYSSQYYTVVYTAVD